MSAPTRPHAPGLARAAGLIAGPGLRQFVRSKGVFAVAALILLSGGIALLVTLNTSSVVDRAKNYQGFQVVLLSVVIVPLVSLLFGTAALATEREGGTLPYLFTRPAPRASVALGKGIAAVALANVAMALAVLATYVGSGAPNNAFPLGGALALGLETTALTSVFVLLGTITARALYVGLGYVAVVEGVLGNVLGDSPYTVSYHARNLLKRWSGNALPTGVIGPISEDPTVSVLVLLGVAVVALAVACVWIERREYGLRDRPKED